MTRGRRTACAAALAIALGGCASGPDARQRETAGCDLLSAHPGTFADARMLALRFSQDGGGCRVTGSAPTPRVADAQRRAIEALAVSRCGARVASSSIVEKARDGVPLQVLAMRIEPPPGAQRCDTGETGADQANVDIASSHAHPPRYPPAAARAGIAGRVTMRVLVDEHGGVAAALVESSSGHVALDDAAYEAVLRWRFRRSGTGLVVARVPIDFAPG